MYYEMIGGEKELEIYYISLFGDMYNKQAN